MAMAQRNEPLRLPASLQQQLYGFRRYVWTVKMAEAAGMALFAVLVAFLGVFAFDRLTDTPVWLRWAVFVGALCGCAVVPLYVHHWIWRRRRFEQLAPLVSARLPRLGDELLGVVELVRSESEQTRSRALCVAAIQQVADYAAKQNLDNAAPKSRHRLWGIFAAMGGAAAMLLAVLCPSAAVNAWARLLSPWAHTPPLHICRHRAVARRNRRCSRRAVPRDPPFDRGCDLAPSAGRDPSGGVRSR